MPETPSSARRRRRAPTESPSPVTTVFDILVPIAVGVVFLVLLAGLRNMMRGGSASTSQKLMRWRVGLQFVAIVVIMAAIWVRGGAPG